MMKFCYMKRDNVYVEVIAFQENCIAINNETYNNVLLFFHFKF